MVVYILSRTLDAVIPDNQRHSYKFSAILGDLQHKIDVYLLCSNFGSVPESFFSNSSQAHYLRTHCAHLVPPPEQPGQVPSDHTLGTVFEFHYYSDLRFRLDYRAFVLRSVSLAL
jgi:hypothetical protein